MRKILAASKKNEKIYPVEFNDIKDIKKFIN